MKKISIFGTGNTAKKVYYFLREKYEVISFFDNNTEKIGKYIDEIQIKKWDKKEFCGQQIIIASVWYLEIAKQLSNAGLKLIKDFIPYNCIEPFEDIEYYKIYQLEQVCGQKVDWSNFIKKDIAIVYGNCQAGVIQNILQKNSDFNRKYCIVKIYPVFAWEKKKEEIKEMLENQEFLQKIDLFIYQIVQKNNKYDPMLSTDLIVEKLKNTCKKISFSNMYFKGYFPQIYKNKKSHLRHINASGTMEYGDKKIDEFIDMGDDKNIIIQKVLNERCFSDKEIDDNIKKSFEELKKREDKVQVKICDYIQENYRKEQLFYSPNHPSRKLIIEMVRRIFNELGIDKFELDESDFYIESETLKGQDIPIYPEVIRRLGIRRYEKCYYINRYMYENLKFDLCGYIDFYITDRERKDII